MPHRVPVARFINSSYFPDPLAYKPVIVYKSLYSLCHAHPMPTKHKGRLLSSVIMFITKQPQRWKPANLVSFLVFLCVFYVMINTFLIFDINAHATENVFIEYFIRLTRSYDNKIHQEEIEKKTHNTVSVNYFPLLTG